MARRGTTACGRGRSLAEVLARLYFGLSYGLLDGSEAGRRILRLAAAGGPAVHGYLTADDLDALARHLGPLAGERVLDLGAGLGEAALEVHRMTGADVIGIDISQRAVDAAARRIEASGAAPHVHVRRGSIADPPRVGAAHAVALDSLMFAPDPAGAVGSLARVLEPGATLFATVIVLGPAGGRRALGWFAGPGRRLLALEDVTPSLIERSRVRARLARGVVRATGVPLRGRAAALLVLAEEAAVGRLAARGLASRWRAAVQYP
jgi:SAM-dependent methyltransferase